MLKLFSGSRGDYTQLFFSFGFSLSIHVLIVFTFCFFSLDRPKVLHLMLKRERKPFIGASQRIPSTAVEPEFFAGGDGMFEHMRVTSQVDPVPAPARPKPRTRPIVRLAKNLDSRLPEDLIALFKEWEIFPTDTSRMAMALEKDKKVLVARLVKAVEQPPVKVPALVSKVPLEKKKVAPKQPKKKADPSKNASQSKPVEPVKESSAKAVGKEKKITNSVVSKDTKTTKASSNPAETVVKGKADNQKPALTTKPAEKPTASTKEVVVQTQKPGREKKEAGQKEKSGVKVKAPSNSEKKTDLEPVAKADNRAGVRPSSAEHSSSSLQGRNVRPGEESNEDLPYSQNGRRASSGVNLVESTDVSIEFIDAAYDQQNLDDYEYALTQKIYETIKAAWEPLAGWEEAGPVIISVDPFGGRGEPQFVLKSNAAAKNQQAISIARFLIQSGKAKGRTFNLTFK